MRYFIFISRIDKKMSLLVSEGLMQREGMKNQPMLHFLLVQRQKNENFSLLPFALIPHSATVTFLINAKEKIKENINCKLRMSIF